MARWLNRFFVFAFFVFGSASSFSQVDSKDLSTPDYKNPDQFKKFNKRSVTVGAWQINQLRSGALVVRLKTNQILIEGLIKQGNVELAREKELEQFAINKNTMFAYRDNFTFCKLYFMLSNSSDSLLNGVRSGIFLDTNLTVDPSIVMSESFYLLAERGYAYNSSIGFVPEDSALFVRERGNPVKEMAVIIKNKYGHQLKNPFPYYVKEKNFMNAGYNFPIRYVAQSNGSLSVFFTINKSYLMDLKNNPEPKEVTRKEADNSILTTIKLKKEFTYEKISLAITELNDNLFQTLRTYPKPDVTRVNPEVKLFFY